MRLLEVFFGRKLPPVDAPIPEDRSEEIRQLTEDHVKAVDRSVNAGLLGSADYRVQHAMEAVGRAVRVHR